MKKQNRLLLHILGWLMFFSPIAVFIFKTPQGNFDGSRLLTGDFLLFVLTYVAIFYLNTYVLLPFLYFRKRLFVYVCTLLVLLISVAAFRPFEHVNLSQSRPDQPANNMRREPPFVNFDRRGPAPPPRHGDLSERGPVIDVISIILFLTVIAASFAISFLSAWRKAVERAGRLEAEKSKSELSYLKAQINPHFLFNTLNSIYSLALENSDKTAAAIVKLSELMRYVMKDASDPRVPLHQELSYIANYVELQKYRVATTTEIVYTTSGSPQGKLIAPLILIPFVENAFKYGVNPEEAGDIKINVEIENNILRIMIRNKKVTPSENTVESGIGIRNARERLELLYPGKHQLHINNNSSHFSVELSLNL